MTLRNNSSSSGLIISERSRAKLGDDPTRGVILKDSLEVNRLSFKEILVDAKSDSFSDDVEVSSREVILRMVADGLE